MKRITYLLLLFLFAHIPTFAQVDNDSIEEDDIIQHADSALLNMLVPDSIVRRPTAHSLLTMSANSCALPAP